MNKHKWSPVDIALSPHEHILHFFDVLSMFRQLSNQTTIPATQFQTNPFAFHDNGQSSQRNQLRLVIDNGIRLIERSQSLFHLLDDMRVSNNTGPLLQPEEGKFDVKIEADVDHDVHFSLEKSSTELFQLELFFLILLPYLRYTLPLPQQRSQCL